MESSRRCLRLVACVFAVLVVLFPAGSVSAQGLMQGARLDLVPTNPFGMPGSTGGLPRGSDTLNLSSRMFPDILPTIPGLEISYLHSFGKHDRWSRLLVEYVRAVRFGVNTSFYGEIHGTLHDLGRSWSSWTGRIDLSAGGGYRRRFGDGAIVGVHGFYDATRLGDEWYSSPSAGGFMMTMLPGDDAIDLTVNWYGGGNTGQFGVGSGAWGQGTFDGTMTYYHELWEGGPDLQLALIGYKVGHQLRPVYQRKSGYGARVQVASRDGMFRGFYMYENDRYIKGIHTVGLYLHVGFRLDNLFALESPIERPTPIFSSPRRLDYWQSVASGTERHLRKNTGGSTCAPSDVTVGPHFSGGPIFVPWGCTLSAADFASLEAVIMDYQILNEHHTNNASISTYWGDSNTRASKPFGSLWGPLDVVGNDAHAPHGSAYIEPATAVSGIWFQSTGTGTWTVYFTDIRLVP